MSVVSYKGYRIIPAPQLVGVNLPPAGNNVAAIGRHGSGWAPAFVIEIEGKDKSKTYLPPGIHETEGAAAQAAVAIAKEVIDGKHTGMTPPK